MLRPDHAIFKSPFAVEYSLEDTATPDNFKMFEPSIGDTIPTFPIFAKRFGEPGLVTSNHGFEDVPDAERILGGINMKGPQYAAVGRHGSIVMWGFQGMPDEFTPAGERLFLNSIAYAVAHRGAKVESLRRLEPRDGLADVLFVWRSAYEKEEGGLARALERVLEGETLPDDVLKDVAASHRWFDSIRPFLRCSDGSDAMARYRLKVDSDCRALGVGNSDPKFLETLAARIAKDPDDALAALLVKRYVPGIEPAGLSTWLAANREGLYFTETDGYVWRARGTAAKSAVLSVEGMGADDPVRIQAKATDRELQLVLSVRPGWHVYSPANREQGMRLRVIEGSSFALDGDFDPPAGPDGEVTGYVQVAIPLKRVAPGDAFSASLTYTVCDHATCKPPRTVTIGRVAR